MLNSSNSTFVGVLSSFLALVGLCTSSLQPKIIHLTYLLVPWSCCHTITKITNYGLMGPCSLQMVSQGVLVASAAGGIGTSCTLHSNQMLAFLTYHSNLLRIKASSVSAKHVKNSWNCTFMNRFCESFTWIYLKRSKIRSGISSSSDARETAISVFRKKFVYQASQNFFSKRKILLFSRTLHQGDPS